MKTVKISSRKTTNYKKKQNKKNKKNQKMSRKMKMKMKGGVSNYYVLYHEHNNVFKIVYITRVRHKVELMTTTIRLINPNDNVIIQTIQPNVSNPITKLEYVNPYYYTSQIGNQTHENHMIPVYLLLHQNGTVQCIYDNVELRDRDYPDTNFEKRSTDTELTNDESVDDD